jgi:cysteinyl-tRNA synthetase
MSMKYLGETFDLHTGGVDNIFPHHENEMAQSEAATGRPFVRCWMHSEHLLVDGEKMSKSKGNFFTLRDLMARGLDPIAIRYFLQTSHYRKQINFTLDGVAQAAAALQRLDDFQDRLSREPAGNAAHLGAAVARSREQFDAAMDDDLNTAAALGALFDLVREANTAFDKGRGSADERRDIGAFLGSFRGLFGVPARTHQIDAAVEALVGQREAARTSKDFATADRIRRQLSEMGIQLEDTPQGVRWKRT